jgi:hypothetical protein
MQGRSVQAADLTRVHLSSQEPRDQAGKRRRWINERARPLCCSPWQLREQESHQMVAGSRAHYARARTQQSLGESLHP